MPGDRGRDRLPLLLFCAGLVWCAGFVASPVAASHGHAAEGALLRMMYAPVCHQTPERSPHVCGAPAAVCTRCASIYAAFTLAALAWPLARRGRMVMQRRIVLQRRIPQADARAGLLLLLPMAADWTLDVAGILTNTQFSRACTGALAGLGLAIVVIPALQELLRGRAIHNPTTEPSVRT